MEWMLEVAVKSLKDAWWNVADGKSLGNASEENYPKDTLCSHDNAGKLQYEGMIIDE